MLCLKISSRGFFFVFLRVFFVFFPRKLSSATRLRKKTKKFKENQKYQRNQKKKQSLGRNGEMLCPRVSSRGLFFLFFLVCLVFFVFFEFFCFFHSEAFIGYRPEKKTKQIRRNPKKQRNKKKQSLGKKLCPRVSSTGLFFLSFFKFFVFSLGCFHRLQA